MANFVCQYLSLFFITVCPCFLWEAEKKNLFLVAWPLRGVQADYLEKIFFVSSKKMFKKCGHKARIPRPPPLIVGGPLKKNAASLCNSEFNYI